MVARYIGHGPGISGDAPGISHDTLAVYLHARRSIELPPAVRELSPGVREFMLEVN